MRLRVFAALLLPGILSGCAALTNPVADGIPVRRLPPELLGESREGAQTIPLTLLRQKPTDAYRLAPGDLLGVWIQGVEPFTFPNQPMQPPPLHFPQGTAQRFPEREEHPPLLGYPFAVRDDGTVSLPVVGPVSVRGLTLAEAQEAIRKAYTAKSILKPGQERIIVNLMRPRLAHVLVFRQDNVTSSLTTANINNNFVVTDVGVTNGASELIGRSTTGTGHLVDLPAYENDVLNALARTGGLPGTNAVSEIMIYRGAFKGVQDRAMLLQQLEAMRRGCPPHWLAETSGLVIRIPVRVRPGDDLPFRPEDVVLQTGDVVYVASQELEMFYTGGLLPSGEHLLPRDYDLDVVQAVLRVRGPLINGAFGGSNLNGRMIQAGIGGPNPSLLTVIRKTPEGGQVPIRVDLNRALRDPHERVLVQAGDVLILQETPGEAMARYFTEQFSFTAIWRAFTRRDAQGTAVFTTP